MQAIDLGEKLVQSGSPALLSAVVTANSLPEAVRLEERIRALETNSSLLRRVLQLERSASVQGWQAVVQGLEQLSAHFFLRLALACSCAGMATAAFACALFHITSVD